MTKLSWWHRVHGMETDPSAQPVHALKDAHLSTRLARIPLNVSDLCPLYTSCHITVSDNLCSLCIKVKKT